MSVTRLQQRGLAQEESFDPAEFGGSNSWELEVFYDSECPLCDREIALLRRLDRHQRVRFTDITRIDYSGNETEKSYDELMAEIHARLPDGTWITGVEAFRRLYSAVGLRWLVMPTRWPVVSQLVEYGYRVFARNRLRLTGRCQGECRIPNASAREVRS